MLGISTDDISQNRRVWHKAVNRQFPILSDQGAKVIRAYGILHAGGDDGKSDDIAIRTTLLVDEQGREVWRRVSKTGYDIANVGEVLARVDQQAQ